MRARSMFFSPNNDITLIPQEVPHYQQEELSFCLSEAMESMNSCINSIVNNDNHNNDNTIIHNTPVMMENVKNEEEDNCLLNSEISIRLDEDDLLLVDKLEAKANNNLNDYKFDNNFRFSNNSHLDKIKTEFHSILQNNEYNIIMAGCKQSGKSQLKSLIVSVLASENHLQNIDDINRNYFLKLDPINPKGTSYYLQNEIKYLDNYTFRFSDLPGLPLKDYKDYIKLYNRQVLSLFMGNYDWNLLQRPFEARRLQNDIEQTCHDIVILTIPFNCKKSQILAISHLQNVLAEKNIPYIVVLTKTDLANTNNINSFNNSHEEDEIEEKKKEIAKIFKIRTFEILTIGMRGKYEEGIEDFELINDKLKYQTFNILKHVVAGANRVENKRYQPGLFESLFLSYFIDDDTTTTNETTINKCEKRRSVVASSSSSMEGIVDGNDTITPHEAIKEQQEEQENNKKNEMISKLATEEEEDNKGNPAIHPIHEDSDGDNVILTNENNQLNDESCDEQQHHNTASIETTTETTTKKTKKQTKQVGKTVEDLKKKRKGRKTVIIIKNRNSYIQRLYQLAVIVLLMTIIMQLFYFHYFLLEKQ
ncbi:hypothetical protein ABK040_002980 [Willaertia magna]